MFTGLMLFYTFIILPPTPAVISSSSDGGINLTPLISVSQKYN